MTSYSASLREPIDSLFTTGRLANMADQYKDAPKGEVYDWHGEVGDLFARRYTTRRWSTQLLQKDWALLRNLCGPRHPSEIGFIDLENKLLELINSGSPNSTLESTVARFKSIFDTLRLLKVIPENHRPDDGLPKYRVKRYEPRPISREQAVHLMTNARHPYNEFFALACLAGLRAMEVATLRGSWLEKGEMGWNLRVFGKGDTELVIPAHPEVVRIIQSYHTTGSIYNLEPNYLSRKVNAEMRRLGIITRTAGNESRLSYHSCRHYFATSVLKASGGNLVLTSQVMRHSNPAVTMRYAALVDGQKSEVINSLDPFDGAGAQVIALAPAQVIPSLKNAPHLRLLNGESK